MLATSGAGLVIPRFVRVETTFYGLVIRHRGEANLEFPSADSADEGIDAATIEFGGVGPLRLDFLGTIFPESEASAKTEISVWCLTTTAQPGFPFARSGPGTNYLWVRDGELRGMIACGRIRSASTVAAWGLLSAAA